jgi:hypothetical protein
MDEAAREQLARRLSAMSLNDARKEVRAIDPKAELKFFRNAIWDEIHTLWLLPDANVSVTLVEKDEQRELAKQAGGMPRGVHKLHTDFSYVEARVETLDRPTAKRGGTGPSSRIRGARRRALQQAREAEADLL